MSIIQMPQELRNKVIVHNRDATVEYLLSGEPDIFYDPDQLMFEGREIDTLYLPLKLPEDPLDVFNLGIDYADMTDSVTLMKDEGGIVWVKLWWD